MTKKYYPNNVLDQAKSALDAWNQIDNEMTFGDLNIAGLVMDINRARGVDEQITSLKNQLTDLYNQRDAFRRAAWDKVKRLRSGVKASFGDDSSQYEMVGGTRASERKTTRRKTTSSA